MPSESFHELLEKRHAATDNCTWEPWMVGPACRPKSAVRYQASLHQDSWYFAVKHEKGELRRGIVGGRTPVLTFVGLFSPTCSCNMASARYPCACNSTRSFAQTATVATKVWKQNRIVTGLSYSCCCHERSRILATARPFWLSLAIDRSHDCYWRGVPCHVRLLSGP